MVKPPPATNRMCFHLGNFEGEGLGALAGGERIQVVRNCDASLRDLERFVKFLLCKMKIKQNVL